MRKKNTANRKGPAPKEISIITVAFFALFTDTTSTIRNFTRSHIFTDVFFHKKQS
jgi:hypothetical protein